MFTPKGMWNDGPELQNFLGPDDAPPVATRHLCYGGGGSISTNVPQVPDYSKYITAMSDVGNQLTGWGRDLYKWAQDSGVDLKKLAQTVSDRAGGMADWATGKAKDYMANWENTYGPIYQQQAKNTMDFIQNLPQTMEQWAGKWGADAATAIDQGKAAVMRRLQSQGLTRPSIAQGAIDLTQSNQRALATTAAAEQGRLSARAYADTLTGQTEQAGTIFPQLSGQMQSTSMAAGNQQLGAPESAISTTAGAYNPAMGMTQAAFPYMAEWGKTMGKQYDQQLQAFQAQVQAQQAAAQQAQASSPMNIIAPIAGMALSAVAPALGAGVGSMMGPVTQGIMAGAGRGIGMGIGGISRTGSYQTYGAEGGQITPMMQGGGGPPAAIPAAVPPMTPPMGPAGPVPMAGSVVPPHLSPSGGQQTDDVHAVVGGNPKSTAAINVGEFIFPKDVVDWRGEQWMQKEIMKARKERQQQTIAAPTMGPPAGAINPRPPMMAGAPA